MKVQACSSFVSFLGMLSFDTAELQAQKSLTGVFSLSGLMRLFQVRIHPISLFRLAFF
jgi:hypothetical protein